MSTRGPRRLARLYGVQREANVAATGATKLYVARGYKAALTRFLEPDYARGLAGTGLCVAYVTDAS